MSFRKLAKRMRKTSLFYKLCKANKINKQTSEGLLEIKNEIFLEKSKIDGFGYTLNSGV